MMVIETHGDEEKTMWLSGARPTTRGREISEQPTICAYCGRQLPEPGGDAYCFAQGRFSTEPACIGCIKLYHLEIVEIMKHAHPPTNEEEDAD